MSCCCKNDGMVSREHVLDEGTMSSECSIRVNDRLWYWDQIIVSLRIRLVGEDAESRGDSCFFELGFSGDEPCESGMISNSELAR